MFNANHFIKKRRHELPITQTELAKRLGMSVQYLNKIEAGKVPVPTAKINKLCKILKINKFDIIEMLTEDYRSKITRRLN